MNHIYDKSAYHSVIQNNTSAEERASQSLVRTVDHLKCTTTNMRGFADSVDHLLNALEELYPFIDKIFISTQSLRSNLNMHVPPHPMYRPYRKR